MPKKKIVEKGTRFGKRTYLGIDGFDGKSRTLKCVCDCGKEQYIKTGYLFGGRTHSCFECANITHGMTNERIYKIWRQLKQRCNNVNNYSYKKRYGSKGIKILWNSFDEFYKDMGESYKAHVKEFGEKNTTLDRIDGNGDYCKENCRWATLKEQTNNLKTNIKISYNGKDYTSLSDLCRELGLSYRMVYMRIKKYGYSIESALNSPKRKHD